MSKTGWWVLFIIIILIIIGVWIGSGSDSTTTVPEVEEDTTPSITEDLEGIDLGDLEQEFQDIDQELEEL